ncbi:TetR/AcrR family transcriptional regulator [Salinibacterium sp. M195]|uniref:TetR/AcrR family transcriptional regulator n=1 Tax=Salinibacterium sp. M195 TaxID=2583374 RepID=UPI001C63752F|nr:TetR family transcriptional regulator [Salinibacterium sp. M195]QYH36648.1 TetR family transcriptional regulator [Salinibacterium sp. M195]
MSDDGTRDVKQERSLERRNAILQAAADLFTTDRISAVTHRRVATEAGVPLGAIRYYFSTREELLIATVNLVEERRHHDALEALTDASPTATTRHCATLLLRAYIGQPHDGTAIYDDYLAASVGWLADATRESHALATQLFNHWPAIEADLSAILKRSELSAPVNLITHVIDGAILVGFAWERGELVERVTDAITEQLTFARARDARE